MSRLKFDPQQVADALVFTKGMVYLASQRLRCDPQTIYNYIRRFRVVKQAFQMASGLTTDQTELKLFEAINRGESWAIAFYLKTKAKDRGYTERTELTGRDGSEINFRVVFDDDGNR